MEMQPFINQAKEMLAFDYNDETITYYLKEAGADADSVPSIIEIAKTRYFEERRIIYTRKNKFSYYLWLSLTITGFIAFLFIIPWFNITIDRVFIFSLIGSAFCCVSGFLAWAYYKTWEPEFVQKVGRPKIQFAFLIIMVVPCVIIHFIFSARFSSVHEDILKGTQVEVTGHVVDGSSVRVQRLLRGGGADFTHIAIEFTTKEGDTQVVSKEVSSYEFKNFYRGQAVPVLYSKTNSRNIAILTDAGSLRKFKNTQEREFEPTDMLRLLLVKQADMGAELNKINYGWVYEPNRNMWVNNRRQSAITTNGHELRFIGNSDYNLIYGDFLLSKGFTKTSTDDQYDLMHTGKKVFENKEYIFNIEAIANQDDSHSIISVIKK